MKFSAILLSFAALVFGSAPEPPTLSYLYTANLTAGVILDIGPGPRGNREFISAAGGTFSGPKLQGTIVAVGGDQGVYDANEGTSGVYTVDVNLVFQTHDGANILVTAIGRSPHEQILFETGSAEYYWVNNVTAVGKFRYDGDDLIIDAWQLCN